MSAVTIKERILSALGMFWDKLKTTYVTSTASNAGDNLALAASAGYNLQQQINELSSKYSTDTLSTSAVSTGFTNTGHSLAGRIEKFGNMVTMTVTMTTGSAINASAYVSMIHIPVKYKPTYQILFYAYNTASGAAVLFYIDGGGEWIKLVSAGSIAASSTYRFTVAYTII